MSKTAYDLTYVCMVLLWYYDENGCMAGSYLKFVPGFVVVESRCFNILFRVYLDIFLQALQE
ncbi:hypothetical protein CEAn_00389 [Coxiella endosymbiont of Amblyomma nuttalli]|nr:hypothetical protein CEAn_00389 [Coxiella endosymbiont of Amblyomma nuttalli]